MGRREQIWSRRASHHRCLNRSRCLLGLQVARERMTETVHGEKASRLCHDLCDQGFPLCVESEFFIRKLFFCVLNVSTSSENSFSVLNSCSSSELFQKIIKKIMIAQKWSYHNLGLMLVVAWRRINIWLLGFVQIAGSEKSCSFIHFFQLFTWKLIKWITFMFKIIDNMNFTKKSGN